MNNPWEGCLSLALEFSYKIFMASGSSFIYPHNIIQIPFLIFTFKKVYFYLPYKIADFLMPFSYIFSFSWGSSNTSFPPSLCTLYDCLNLSVFYIFPFTLTFTYVLLSGPSIFKPIFAHHGHFWIFLAIIYGHSNVNTHV